MFKSSNGSRSSSRSGVARAEDVNGAYDFGLPFVVGTYALIGRERPVNDDDSGEPYVRLLGDDDKGLVGTDDE